MIKTLLLRFDWTDADVRVVGAAGQAPVPQAPPSIGYVTVTHLAEVPDVNAGFVRLQALQQQKSTELAAKQQGLDGTRQHSRGER
jgi:hypothetical protein